MEARVLGRARASEKGVHFQMEGFFALAEKGVFLELVVLELNF
jgi:hypothetical protein